jgi:hypothetical protein
MQYVSEEDIFTAEQKKAEKIGCDTAVKSSCVLIMCRYRPYIRLWVFHWSALCSVCWTILFIGVSRDMIKAGAVSQVCKCVFYNKMPFMFSSLSYIRSIAD